MIWVTGVGLVTPIGIGVQPTMDGLLAGQCSLDPLTLFSSDGYRSSVVGEVKNLPGHDVLPGARVVPEASRTETMATLAAAEALEQAKLDLTAQDVGLVMGGTTGASFEVEPRLPGILPEPLDPGDLTEAMVNPLAETTALVARRLGPFSRVRTLCSACSTGAMAVVLGAAWLRSGRVDRVLVGAADALCRVTLAGFNALGALDVGRCRPFDARRRGLNLGEGAGFLVLETSESAKRRGVKPLATLAGWGAGAEAHHITQPDPGARTASRVVAEAITSAGITPDAIDYVNAHGTATPHNDAAEMRALRTAMGSALDDCHVSSTKGHMGHTLGAAGAIEAVIAVMAVVQGAIPPTVGLEQVDQACDGPHVLGTSMRKPVRYAMSTSFGFGGLDVALVVGAPANKPRESRERPAVFVDAAVATVGHDEAILGDAFDLFVGCKPVPGPLPDDLLGGLDARRARRLGRPERLVARQLDRLLDNSDMSREQLQQSRPLLVTGRRSGSPADSAKFVGRILGRGPRYAPPAMFPNLIESALAGHMSIYHHLEGPAFSSAARRSAGLSAFLSAWEWLEGGMGDVAIASAVAPWDGAQLLPNSRHRDDSVACEGGASILLSTRGRATQVEPRVRIVDGWSWRTKRALDAALTDVPEPANDARVFAVGEVSSAELPSGWRDVSHEDVTARLGDHDALGVAALVVGASWVAARTGREALLVVPLTVDGVLLLLRNG